MILFSLHFTLHSFFVLCLSRSSPLCLLLSFAPLRHVLSCPVSPVFADASTKVPYLPRFLPPINGPTRRRDAYSLMPAASGPRGQADATGRCHDGHVMAWDFGFVGLAGCGCDAVGYMHACVGRGDVGGVSFARRARRAWRTRGFWLGGLG